ncbi:MAG: riboflavin synthase [Salibacteraceae bacterium]
MFTGIIETVAEVVELDKEGSNLHIKLKNSIAQALKVDQSVAHNGVCLTVVDIENDTYTVTAIEETLNRTTFGELSEGESLNIERCMSADGRFDGHIVQGHVDTMDTVTSVENRNGSWNYHFNLNENHLAKIVEKGSICINGVSLTVVDVADSSFSVSIIPYTYKHTTFHQLKKGDRVNIEYDILGKYVSAALEARSVS